jgi:DNA-binding Lrp family transcriptional regulator
MTKRPVAPVWTPEDDDRLRAAATTGESIASISKRLRRSEKAVDNRIRRLGLEWAGRPKRGQWSFKEQRQLMKLAAASQSLEIIADRLQRPAETVLRMARRLGVSVGIRKAKRK